MDTATYEGKLWAVPFTSNAGLLYYRKDILARQAPAAGHLGAAGQRRPGRSRRGTTWPGYAGQFAAYEGLTVNFAEAVQSAGGSILSPGRQPGHAELRRRPGRALGFLVSGFRQGWIPRAALGYDEAASQQAFESGQAAVPAQLALRLRPGAARPGPGNKVAGKFGVDRRCPARTGQAPARSAGPTWRSARSPGISALRWRSSSSSPACPASGRS